MWTTIASLIKVVLFFIDLWKEKDEKKAEEKKEVAERIVDAFKQTDRKTRASRLNAAVGDIKRLRR